MKAAMNSNNNSNNNSNTNSSDTQSRLNGLSVKTLRQQAAFDCLRTARDPASRWTAKSLSLQIKQKDDFKETACGISVSRKTAKRAVDRNRIKRRLRAAAKLVLPRHAAPQTHYLITGRTDALTHSFKDLQNDLVWCIRKLNQNREQARQEQTPPTPQPIANKGDTPCA